MPDASRSIFRSLRFLAISMLAIAIPAVKAAEGASVASYPPVVVRTIPASGDTGVDPSLTEIRVTFSKPMLTKEMWSFVYAKPAAFPEVTGPVRYVDDRTVVMPVALKPGTAYGTWINSQDHNAFRDTGQRPAVPYLLVFETR